MNLYTMLNNLLKRKPHPHVLCQFFIHTWQIFIQQNQFYAVNLNIKVNLTILKVIIILYYIGQGLAISDLLKGNK